MSAASLKLRELRGPCGASLTHAASPWRWGGAGRDVRPEAREAGGRRGPRQLEESGRRPPRFLWGARREGSASPGARPGHSPQPLSGSASRAGAQRRAHVPANWAGRLLGSLRFLFP